MTTGRIDVHSHLLPAIDDGCETTNQSIRCARELVANGYTHAFCTPHVWPSNPHITNESILRWTAELQRALDEANVPLRLMPGGELSIQSRLTETPAERVATFGMRGRHALVDMWADAVPEFFAPAIRWLQAQDLTVILAHPERMRAVQLEPDLADTFADMGVLLQGNLQCFSDPPDRPTCRVAQQYLREGRYFLLGSDTHRPDTIGLRMNGLRRAVKLVGEDAVNRLTIENPRILL